MNEISTDVAPAMGGVPVEPVLSMAAGSFLDVSAEEFIDVCATTEHLQGFGLRVSGEHHLDRGRCNELRKSIAARGRSVFDVEVHRIGASTGSRIDSVDTLIEMAASIGAKNVLVVGDIQDRDAVEGELRRIVRVAADHDVGVGLEYMAWTMPHSLHDARHLAEVTGCRLVVDALHHTRLGFTVDDLQTIIADGLLGWVQICDARSAIPESVEALIHEARHDRLIPGRGALPIEELLSVVPASTTISIEVQSDELLAVDPRERARQLVQSSREVLRNSLSR